MLLNEPRCYCCTRSKAHFLPAVACSERASVLERPTVASQESSVLGVRLICRCPAQGLLETKMRQKKRGGERSSRRREKGVQDQGRLDCSAETPRIATRYCSLVSLYSEFAYFSTHPFSRPPWLPCTRAPSPPFFQVFQRLLLCWVPWVSEEHHSMPTRARHQPGTPGVLVSIFNSKYTLNLYHFTYDGPLPFSAPEGSCEQGVAPILMELTFCWSRCSVTHHTRHRGSRW